MLHRLERRLSHLEALIPPRVTFARFISRVCERARRCGVSPGPALVTALEALSLSEINLFIEELEGEPSVRSVDEAPEVSSSATEFSPEDIEVVIRYYGESGC